MKAYVLATLAAAGVLLAGACSHKEPEDVTPSTTPSVSNSPSQDSVTAGAAGAVKDSAAAAAGAVTDSAAAAAGAVTDSAAAAAGAADTMHMPTDTTMTMPSADSAAKAARDSM